jgi:predicted alpha/beta hydrolase
MTDDTPVERLRIPARDGYALAAAVYGRTDAARVVLVAPATGVRLRLYDAFARSLAAELDAAVVTWDWRGTGESRPASLRGFRVTMREWATLDLAGVIDWASARWPGAELAGVGHSFGGQSFGLAPNADRFARLVTIAAQSGWYGHWPRRLRLRYALLWHVVMPGVTRALGYFPGRRLGLGEDLPGGVALEWARWCRSPGYLGDWSGHAAVRAPILAIGFSDDDYAPPAAVDALHREYNGATVEHRTVTPVELGLPRIGHFGIFRDGGRPVWGEVAGWLREEGSTSRGVDSALYRS